MEKYTKTFKTKLIKIYERIKVKTKKTEKSKKTIKSAKRKKSKKTQIATKVIWRKRTHIVRRNLRENDPCLSFFSGNRFKLGRSEEHAVIRSKQRKWFVQLILNMCRSCDLSPPLAFISAVGCLIAVQKTRLKKVRIESITHHSSAGAHGQTIFGTQVLRFIASTSSVD